MLAIVRFGVKTKCMIIHTRGSPPQRFGWQTRTFCYQKNGSQTNSRPRYVLHAWVRDNGQSVAAL